MYYEFEGRMNMKPLIFDDDCLMVGELVYPYDEIESLEVTSPQLFAYYGLLSLGYDGKIITIPFPRSYTPKINRVLRELEREKKGRKSVRSTDKDIHTYTHGSPDLDPYEEMKKLKELLDLDIITDEEFARKKKELLNL